MNVKSPISYLSELLFFNVLYILVAKLLGKLLFEKMTFLIHSSGWLSEVISIISKTSSLASIVIMGELATFLINDADASFESFLLFPIFPFIIFPAPRSSIGYNHNFLIDIDREYRTTSNQ